MARNAIATSHPLSTEAGLSMIRKGGNALDAALAAAITLTVVEPTGNGLGWTCILWDEQGTARAECFGQVTCRMDARPLRGRG